jgi:lysophospholipase L1-like esterase
MKRFCLGMTGSAAVLTLLLCGCSVETPDHPALEVAQPTGPQIFANYVAIGNSLTAGFMDAGLHMAGQRDSYPAIIARQMGLDASPGSQQFTQPWIAHPGIGRTDTGDPDLIAGVLYWTGTSIDVIGATPLAQVPALAIAQAFPIPYNNLAVPGATVVDVAQAVDATTSLAGDNSFFDLILRNPTFGNVTMLGQCIARGPTLVTMWIGNNPWLSGATSGAPVADAGGNIVPASVFAALFEQIISGIENGVMARTGYAPVIVAANIPSVTSFAYFLPKPVFDMVAGGQIPTVEEDVALVCFPALAYLGGGGQPPLPDYLTLTTDEVSLVETVVGEYNDHIDTICAAHGVSVVDVSALLEELMTQGIDGLTGAHFILQQPFPNPAGPVTAFSLDGLHPNNMGQGIIANAFIDKINEAAGVALAPVDVASLTWDPTYSAYAPRGSDRSGPGLISAAAARALEALSR